MKYTTLGNSNLRVSRICMGCMGSVSYTHLDVYKRQVLHCCHGRHRQAQTQDRRK